ncbi:Arm DNA-binding domain-containing protein [Duganella flavida]|uniref:Arm DNA-binding domain-containing protein n=1 Tax=Duganella flavida TaxID=2692175 RepID=UPI002803DB37|nr:Arm DNA-binding domain-containing protein [Duganella flavida]
MPLTDTFVRQVKPSKPSGDKHADGSGMYLLLKPTGKYWRLDYRYLGVRKTLALGIYPDVSLAKARKRREEARTLIADGIAPGADKREKKLLQIAAATNTFEAAARQ